MTPARQALAQCTLWQSAWAPADRRPIWEWAKDNLSLIGDFAQKGPFIASEWMKPLFEDWKNPHVRRIHCRKGNRVGGTLIPIVGLNWTIAENPAPFLWAMQTDEMMEKQLEKRIMPVMTRGCPRVASLMPSSAPQDKIRRVGQTKKKRMNIYFPAASVSFGGANINTLQSDGYAYVICDEIWLKEWQKMWAHAVARTYDYEAIGETKIYSSSQGGVEGDLEDTVFKAGNQAHLYFRCPSCNGSTPIAFNPEHWGIGLIREDKVKTGVVWDEACRNRDGYFDPERAKATARYRCFCCLAEFAEDPGFRRKMDASQHMISANPKAAADYKSYHVETMVYRDMGRLALDFCLAYNSFKQGVIEPRQIFRQKQQALPAVEDAIEPINFHLAQEDGYKYADYVHGEIWEKELDRALTIDRQKKGFWAEVGAWTGDGAYRQLFYGYLEKSEELILLQNQYKVRPACVMEDCGYEPTEVFNDAIKYHWIPLRGCKPTTWDHRQGQNIVKNPFFSQPEKVAISPGVFIYKVNFSSHDCKDILHRRLSGGGRHHGLPLDISAAWRRHIDGEIKKETKSGTILWTKIADNSPNHANDTGAMQIAFALIRGFIRVESVSVQ